MCRCIKEVTTGGMGDTTKEFTYTLSGTGAAKGDTVSHIKYSSDSDTTGTAGTVTADDSDNMTFTLKHGERVVFAVPADAEVTAAVTNGTYTTAFSAVKDSDSSTVSTTAASSLASGNTGCVLTVAEATTLTVTNTQETVSPTGVTTRVLPFALIAFAGAGLWLTMRRRRRV